MNIENKQDLEEIRARFEEWYATTNYCPYAEWHPVESLSFGQAEYPNGRYTVMTFKQQAWTVWQAAYAAANKN